MFQPLLVLSYPSKEQLKKFELIFSNVYFPEDNYTTGRKPHSKSALLRAVLYKNLRGLPTLADLSRELKDNPQIAQLCGFNSFPSKERFSAFLRTTPNQLFQSIRVNLVKKLIQLKQISTNFISCDSCPVFAPVKENNLRTYVNNRYDKTKILKGDRDSKLGAYTIYTDQKKPDFFWGYRNHIVNDAISELPIAEITKPNTTGDSTVFIPQFTTVKQTFKSKIDAVIADAAYDSYPNIEFVVKELEAKPIIAKNPRGGCTIEFELSSSGQPICIAGIPMLSRGIFYDKEQKRWRHKFICRIKGSKKFAQKIPLCPWNHRKFIDNRYGCCVNLRVDVDQSIRQSIDYGSESFKKLYNLRTSSERVFSRLLTFCMQYPTVKGLNAVSNFCTIAHITILIIALTAVKTGHKDKIRFVKSLFPYL